MDEIITIDMSVFLGLRPNPQKLITNDKISDIFALDCFNENSAKFTTHTFKSKPINPYQNHRIPLGQRPQLIKTISYHDKLMREVTGIINKINASNIQLIFKKIERVIDANNVNLISEIVLDKSTIHTSYMFELVKLLDVMRAHYEELVAKTISHYIETFVDTLTTNLTLLLELDYKNYDQYCLFVLRKKVLINKVTLVLYLLHHYHYSSYTPDDIFTRILQQFNTFRSNAQMQVLVLEMLDTVFRNYEDADAVTMAIDFGCIDDLTLKSKFIFQDIMEHGHKNVRSIK